MSTVRAFARLAGALVGVALLAGMLPTRAAAQSDGAAQTAIRAALTQWMADFNARRIDKVCDLFAPDLIAQFRGQPETSYTALCNQLTHSLSDPTRTYSYSLAINEILVFGDIAVVRLVWTLKVERPGASAVTTDETGMDIFRRQPNGDWKIARFIAYDLTP
jgi:steroid delta-isomerase